MFSELNKFLFTKSGWTEAGSGAGSEAGSGAGSLNWRSLQHSLRWPRRRSGGNPSSAHLPPDPNPNRGNPVIRFISISTRLHYDWGQQVSLSSLNNYFGLGGTTFHEHPVRDFIFLFQRMTPRYSVVSSSGGINRLLEKAEWSLSSSLREDAVRKTEMGPENGIGSRFGSYFSE